MGFVARGNTIVSDPSLYLQERGKWLPKFIRAYQPGAAFTTYHNATSLTLTDRYVNLNPIWFQFQHGGIFSYNLILTKQNLENDFHPLDVTISKGSYDYTRHKISISSDQSKNISAVLIGNLGQFYDARYNSLTTTVSFAPSPHLFISPNIEFGKLEKVGVDQTIENVTLYTIEGRLALNPRVQLTGLLQRSSVTNSIGYNVRFAWEFKPLSYFYIVFNNNSVSQVTEAVNQQLIAKISYLKHF